MSEISPNGNRSVVMLTADRHIDRRILLGANSLEAAGWEVKIIAMPFDEEEDDNRVVRIGADVAHARRRNLVLHVYCWVRSRLPMNGILMRWLKRMAWRYLVDHELFYTSLFYSTASRYSPNVFVAHDLPMLPVAKRVADACGARLVYDSHELFSEQEFSRYERRRWEKIEAKYISACDVVITVNQSIAAELKNRYDIGDIKVICNAECTFNAPAKTLYFHEVFGLAADKKVLLLQGYLSTGRHLEALVHAMCHVKNPSVILVFLGDGVLLGRLQKIARSIGLDGRVFFHPPAPQKDLLSYTVAADAGVIPYQATCLNNYYCTPNKLFEFIAAGLPILASDLPEIKTLVEGRNIGLVGDTSTPEKFAALIDDFFSSSQRLDAWRANLHIVRKSVCWEQEEKKLVEIYRALQ